MRSPVTHLNWSEKERNLAMSSGLPIRSIGWRGSGGQAGGPLRTLG
jgi:hypothetical protein